MTADRTVAMPPVTDPVTDPAADRFAEAGVDPEAWSVGPGYRFPAHAHPHAKLLTCRSGSITFRLDPDGEVWELGPGSWIRLPPGQVHSAEAGPRGVQCAEAFLGADGADGGRNGAENAGHDH